MSSSEEYSDDDHHHEEDSDSSDGDSPDDSESYDEEDSNLDESDAASESSESSDSSDSDNSDPQESVLNNVDAIDGLLFLFRFPEVMSAIENNDLDAMGRLIDEGFDVNKCCTISLHGAISRGSLEMVQKLLNAGAEPGTVGPFGLCAFNTAIRVEDTSKRWAMVRLLINSGVNVKNDEHLEESYMHEAVYRGDVDLVKFLFDAGAEVNRINAEGRTPVQLSITQLEGEVCLRMVRQLLQLGAHVNIKDKKGYTCLHLVANKDSDQYELTEILLEAGAQLNCVTNDGRTPLATAASWGDCKLMRLMIDAGAEINPIKVLDESALALAVLNHHKNAVELLLEHGVDINLKSADGTIDVLACAVIDIREKSDDTEYIELLQIVLNRKPLDVCTEFEKTTLCRGLFRSGSVKALQFFIKNGIELKTCKVLHPLHEAALNPRAEILEYLLQTYLYNIDECDNNDSTALMTAILSENTACVKLLLEWGVDVEKSKTLPGTDIIMSPVCAAVLKKNLTILNLLLAAGAKPDPNYKNEGVHEFLVTKKRSKINNCLIAQSILLEPEMLSEINPQAIFSGKYPKKFVGECLTELKNLKNQVLFGSVTLYDFLKGTDVTDFMTNSHVTDKLESPNITEIFSIYGKQIEACYSMASVKKSVMNQAVRGLRKILGARFHNCYFIHRGIMLHLSMKDLRNLCHV